jgi:DNA-binding transcriptional MerR regulator/methylmalonyl-CoA mutase cobalamin-binding subunit
MNSFTIKDLESLSGIKAHTIRIWEQRYGFIKPQRTATNIRYYSNDELKTLLNVSLLNKHGYKISKIDQMTAEQMQQSILSLPGSDAIQERLVNEMVHLMVELQVNDVDSLLAEQIKLNGVEHTILELIFPFLERIGILWLTGHINPAQEHLITNLIRQKLLVAIENTSPSIRKSATALLFLPEGEYHEMGLLFLYYLLKSSGVLVYYIGANAPISDVAYVVEAKKPTVIFTHITSAGSKFSMEKFLDRINKKIPNTSIVITGLTTQQYKKPVPATVQFMKSLSEVKDYISSL